MQTSKNLFDIVQANAEKGPRLVLIKWREYTLQYEGDFGILCEKSRLIVWRYNHVACVINCRQLTVNDEKKCNSELIETFPIAKLIEAIEADEVTAIGGLQQMWRVTLGGYIANKRRKGAFKDD